MYSIFLKEIKSFLSSILGLIVIGTFLIISGLFIWVFPGELNILESGYADLVPFFTIAPWVFLILIPGITMRFFAEEKRTGTLEFLMTKPLGLFQLILAKWFAGVVLVAVSLLPTIIYAIILSRLAVPEGNIDVGAIVGSYVGLFFLAINFVAIGIFASSITNNQIIAFLLAVFICFIVFSGLDSLSTFDLLGNSDHFVRKLGILEHYKSLRRGVIDTRDIAYFVASSLLFFGFTKLSLESRNW